MQRTLAILTAIVVGALAVATLIPTGAVRAQSATPAVIYRAYLPLIADPTNSLSSVEPTMASQVLALVNNERASQGCAPLSADAKLTAAAQAHSEDMARNDFFSHTGSDGSSSAERVTRAGYSWQMTGENIAAGQTTADAVMASWMQSPGHRANILNCAYTQIGIGYVYEAGDSYPGPYGYRHYWAQVFGTPQ